MFAHRRELIKGLATLVCALALIALAGCGEGEDAPQADATLSTTSTGDPSKEPGSPRTADADPEDLAVISGWSTALSEGDLKAAAGYFATPSTAENGPVLIKIESLADALAFNDSLPCGAEVVSARTTGELTTATFRLSERPGGSCGGGVGGRASTSFEIADGKIVEWRRIDDLAPSPGAGGGGEGSPV